LAVLLALGLTIGFKLMNIEFPNGAKIVIAAEPPKDHLEGLTK
jgi:hypothetical protein